MKRVRSVPGQRRLTIRRLWFDGRCIREGRVNVAPFRRSPVTSVSCSTVKAQRS